MFFLPKHATFSKNTIIFFKKYINNYDNQKKRRRDFSRDKMMMSSTMIRNTSPYMIQFQSRLQQHILPMQLFLSQRQISGNTLDKIQDDDDDPLILLRNRAMKKNLCNEYGDRLPGKFWNFSLSASQVTNNESKVRRKKFNIIILKN